MSNKAHRIATLILEDVTSRKGLDHMFHEFDPDVQSEIFNEWVRLIDEELEIKESY